MAATDWKKLEASDLLPPEVCECGHCPKIHQSCSPQPCMVAGCKCQALRRVRPSVSFHVTEVPPPHEAPLRARVQEVIWKVELRRFAYDVRWVLTAPHITPLGITLIASSVPDRDTGALADVVVPTMVPAHLLDDDDEAIARFLFELLVTFVRHEAAEAFHLGGARVFDPHASKEAWTHEGPLRRR